MVDMKTINNQPGQARVGSRPSSAVARDGAAGAARADVSSVAGTQVTVTDTVNMLRQIEEQIARVPVMDNERVAELREAIRNGTFKIDPRKTAEKLLAFA